MVVDRSSHLVYTPQLLPLANAGSTIVTGGASEQAGMVIDRLASVLKGAGSGLDKLVKG